MVTLCPHVHTLLLLGSPAVKQMEMDEVASSSPDTEKNSAQERLGHVVNFNNAETRYDVERVS